MTSPFTEDLRPAQGFMFDLDGTLILSDKSLGGYTLLPGAVELLTELEQRGIPFLALTNGSAYPARQQAPRLRALGLPIPDERLFTPNSVAAREFNRTQFQFMSKAAKASEMLSRMSTVCRSASWRACLVARTSRAFTSAAMVARR